jgi:hypothetical protein
MPDKMYAMFIFEIKPNVAEDWIEVTDDIFMDMLYRTYNKLTPVIKQMLDKQDVHVKGCAYRIRAKKETK